MEVSATESGVGEMQNREFLLLWNVPEFSFSSATRICRIIEYMGRKIASEDFSFSATKMFVRRYVCLCVSYVFECNDADQFSDRSDIRMIELKHREQ